MYNSGLHEIVTLDVCTQNIFKVVKTPKDAAPAYLQYNNHINHDYCNLLLQNMILVEDFLDDEMTFPINKECEGVYHQSEWICQY